MTITNGYATRDDIKNALRIPLSDTQDDDLIDVAVEAASREIDGYCERVFYSTSGTRVYIPQILFLVETDDLDLAELPRSPYPAQDRRAVVAPQADQASQGPGA